MEIFNKDEIPKGYMGVVAPDGTFYAISKTGALNPYHQINLAKLARYLEKEDKEHINMASLFRKAVDEGRITNPDEFYLLDSFDYKAGFIDLFGFCNYESTGKANKFAAINIPRVGICGKKITKSQRETLIKLVQQNNDSLESLEIIFEDNTSITESIAKEKMIPPISQQIKY